MLRRVTHVLFVCLSVLMSPMVSGQTSAGSLAGSVFGPDGKAVAGAALMVRNDVSGDLRTTVTDSGGRFSVGGLTFGAYTIEIFVPGFETVRRAAQLASDRTEEIAIKLTVANITESVTVSAALPEAAVAAPSQASLTARSAQSLISNEYIRNYTSPISDYSQVLQMAPGTYSVSSNGPGLGDTKTFFRGFKDGQYSMTYDGIPFNDTNDPTHHSWVFFPAQTIGSTVFDRSPGSASSIGPSTYGGSVGLISRSLGADRLLNGTVSYGSFNTRMFDVDFNTGRFGTDGKSRLMIDAHEMRSDGYQTFNFQQRDAFSAKYSYQASANTSVTAFSSIMHLKSHTPNQKGATRQQIEQFGDNFLMTDNPASPLYYKFNFYSIPTDFEYVGVRTLVGGGWSIDNKTYTMRYHNKQNYNGVTTISATSATDKLNAYRKYGNNLPVTYVSERGIFRTGLWSEYASTDRYQTPSDPRTWDRRAAAKLPRTIRNDDAAAVCGVRTACRTKSHRHAGAEVCVLSAESHAVCRQRQDRRQPEWGAVGESSRRVPRDAPLDRRARPRAAVLVDVRAVRARAEHPADERLRREERTGRHAAETGPDRHGADRIRLEVAPGDARRRRVSHQLPE
jgi:hypothetical protein